MPEIKRGALTFEELKQLWRAALDPTYRRALENAGLGGGLETHWQLLKQFERVSLATDVTTQEMYIAPWSGQTNPSAGGAVQATVTLAFARALRLELPLILDTTVFARHTPTIPTTEGPVSFFTGRRYGLDAPLVLFPGDVGPVNAACTADRPGHGYNNPLPDTINVIEQFGLNHENDFATVVLLSTPLPKTQIITPNEPDTFVPEHVGQYMRFTAGKNAGQIARVIEFVGPDLTVYPPIGSKATLEIVFCGSGTFTGAIAVGETVTNGSGYTGTVAAIRYVSAVASIVVATTTGTTTIGDVLMGSVGAGTITLGLVLYDNALVAEAPVGGVGGASWEILPWDEVLGLTVTNADSPSGGRLGMLDELGQERSVARATGEADSSYVRRIRDAGDVVTPNAIVRAALRSLPEGSMVCLREAGSTKFRGMFFDGTPESSSLAAGRGYADCFDYGMMEYLGTIVKADPQIIEGERVFLETSDFLVSGIGIAGPFVTATPSVDAGPTYTGSQKVAWRFRDPLELGAGFRIRGERSGAIFTITDFVPNAFPDRKYRVLFDYEKFRAFFEIDVPIFPYGDFGTAFDAAYNSAFDYNATFDGEAAIALDYYAQVDQALKFAKAGGVGYLINPTLVDCREDDPDNFASDTLIDPKTLPGVMLALESDVGVTIDGSNRVSAWADQSGNAFNFAQATAGVRPLYLASSGPAALPTLNFDGTRFLTATRKTFSSAWTLMFAIQTALDPGVYTSGTPNPTGTIVGDSDAGYTGQYGIGNLSVGNPIVGVYTTFDGAAWNTFRQFDTPVNDNTVRVLAVRHTGTVIDVFQDGLLEASNTGAPAFSTRGIDTIGRAHGAANYFKGALYAVYAFSSALSDRNLRLLAYRARAKFGGR